MNLKLPLFEEAAAFLELFWRETRAAGDLETRLAMVEEDIERTGTWTPSFEELEHGGRVAWRNNARCIGRLMWRSLQVRDCRHVTSRSAVFEECRNHLRRATNGGNIRPLMTVFPAASVDKGEWRIWNYQLLGYAGWPSESHPGDPMQGDFTRAICRLGWSGPGMKSNFDLLPLAVQSPDGRVDLYEWQPGDVREVEIEHPTLGFSQEMKLKWYAVPAVSNMCFHFGGLRFTAAPFNGYYMGTEIGARNLADAHRYDLLPEIARRMGLDTSRDSTLWKDRALVELNVAVLDSFERAGVTIVDHHTVSAQFMQFLENERRQERVVSGDWSWLVPPMSSSTTPVFHRYYENRVELPNFLPQEPAYS
ncbi:MAG TPA: nitric oxide synthase oxygenase [Chthoniobacterales bacterium]